MIGQTISHYRILEKLGEGGMGVVYKAQDLTLDRYVALKFLPPQLSASAEEKTRLTQEAKSASALNHPNVATIHEIDEADGQTFLVMEYVDGMTLRQKGQTGPLKIKEIVGMAIQAAEALQKAHEQQIIHRDIKSDNIMINRDGLVKVMDFGLAKLKGAAKITKAGSTVGTAAYMSPEQIQGEETDHRTDIFSYGVVLYEMLAGQLPFRGEHEAALMYEIVNVQPLSLLHLEKKIDTELNRIVMKCLEKERDERYQSMREVVVDLKRYKRDSEGKRIERPVPTVTDIKPSLKEFSFSPILLGTLAVLVLAVVAWFYFSSVGEDEPTAAEAKLSKVTFNPGLEDEPTWSPDGKFLAYTTDEKGNLDIIVLPLGGGKPIWVVDSPADDAQPSWSPDGSKLAFVSARDRGGRLSVALRAGDLQWYINAGSGDIFIIPALGGRAVKLVDNAHYPSWSPDGKTIVFQADRGGQWDLYVIPAEGGQATQLTNDPEFDYQPNWSPDGESILYGSGAPGAYEVRAIPARGGAPIVLTEKHAVVLRPAWVFTGRDILFSSTQSGVLNIWKTSFSPSRDDSRSPVSRITLGQGDDINVDPANDGRRLAFATIRNTPDIWELTVESQLLRQVTQETSMEDYPHLSPDGKTILVTSDRGGKVELWTMDLNGRVLSQLTSSDSASGWARWSPHGKEVAYSQGSKIVIQQLADVAAHEIGSAPGFAPDWSPDGKKLAYARSRDGKFDICVYSRETGEELQLTTLESDNLFPSWSPEGTAITFNSQTGNTRNIWIVPSEGGTPRQLTFGDVQHSHPQWSPLDNDQILFVKDHKNLCLLSVSTSKIKQITNFVESNVVIDYPSWSFDGKKVYFSLAKKVGDVYILENY